jgi:hypothetical protein
LSAFISIAARKRTFSYFGLGPGAVELSHSPAQTAAAHPKNLHSQLRYKRLEDGVFRWPKIEDGVMRLSAAELSALLEGLDWRRVRAARETVVPTQAG